MSEITEVVVARMVELSPLDMGKAEAIAEEFGVKARAVIASAVRRGIPYVKKARVSKAGVAVVSKADLVARIAERAGVNVADLDGLDKASKSSLEILAG